VRLEGLKLAQGRDGIGFRSSKVIAPSKLAASGVIPI